MTQPTPEQMDRARKAAAAYWQTGDVGDESSARSILSGEWDDMAYTQAALAAILQSDQQQAVLRDQLDAVMRHIPMDYLQRHDVPGATGPTAALNLKAAMKDYAEDRWKLIDRLKGQAVLLRRAEAMAGALEAIRNLPGELNPSNYDDADVAYLNTQFIEAFHIADDPLTAFREWQGGRSDA